MVETNLVVVRYRDGHMVKGTTQDFYPDHTLFHVQERGGASTVPVKMADLKAVFFVKDLVGNPERVDQRQFVPIDPGLAAGKRIAVLFKDGELMVGYTLGYTIGRPGFWVIPADPDGNNIRVYVVTSATKQVKVGPAADEMAKSAPKRETDLKRVA